MSCSQYFLHTLLDMGSLLGTVQGTIQAGPLCPVLKVPNKATVNSIYESLLYGAASPGSNQARLERLRIQGLGYKTWVS